LGHGKIETCSIDEGSSE